MNLTKIYINQCGNVLGGSKVMPGESSVGSPGAVLVGKLNIVETGTSKSSADSSSSNPGG